MNDIYHHGIRGQHWGQRNGPPYPLKGGQYSSAEKREMHERKTGMKNSLYKKRHEDQVIYEGHKISTLAHDPNRTTDTDMFFAASDWLDKQQYRSLFNQKVEREAYDSEGNPTGHTGKFHKMSIENKLVKDMKVASEDSGIDAFMDLYKNNRDFYNFVTDPDRLGAYFDDAIRTRFKGYREAEESLHKIQNDPSSVTQKDLETTYRLFNYAIPYDGKGNESNASDMKAQRAKFFKELEKNGYSAVLDTNDAIYGGMKAREPIIVFDSTAFALDQIKQTTGVDVAVASVIMSQSRAVEKVLGK